jgi:hypothetical protein
MLNFRRFIVPTMILCALAPLRAAADAAAEAHKQFQALYNKENAAVMRGDWKGALSNTTADFVTLDPKGKQTTRAQMEQMMPQLLALMKNMKATTEVTKVTLKGKEARVSIKEHATATITNPQTKKTGKFVVDDTGEDVWTKTEKGWRKKSSKGITVKQSMDGKPIPGM